MSKQLKVVFFIFLSFIILFNLVSSAEIVQVQQQQEPPKTGIWQTIKNTITSPLFIGFVVVALFVLIVGVIIILIINWAIKYYKSQNDIFLKVKKERMILAKAQARFNSNHPIRIKKNIPIRLVRLIDEKPVLSKPIAYYRGDYKSNEGNIIISMNMQGRKTFFIFPKKDLLIIPNKEQITLTTINKEGKKEENIIKLPKADDIVKFNDGEILIYAESLSQTAHFFIPVLRSKDNKIINLALPTYQSLKEVIIENYLYDQTSDFVGVAKKTMDLNPNLRYETKANDSNQSIETDKPQ